MPKKTRIIKALPDGALCIVANNRVYSYRLDQTIKCVFDPSGLDPDAKILDIQISEKRICVLTDCRLWELSSMALSEEWGTYGEFAYYPIIPFRQKFNKIALSANDEVCLQTDAGNFYELSERGSLVARPAMGEVYSLASSSLGMVFLRKENDHKSEKMQVSTSSLSSNTTSDVPSTDSTVSTSSEMTLSDSLTDESSLSLNSLRATPVTEEEAWGKLSLLDEDTYALHISRSLALIHHLPNVEGPFYKMDLMNIKPTSVELYNSIIVLTDSEGVHYYRTPVMTKFEMLGKGNFFEVQNVLLYLDSPGKANCILISAQQEAVTEMEVALLPEFLKNLLQENTQEIDHALPKPSVAALIEVEKVGLSDELAREMHVEHAKRFRRNLFHDQMLELRRSFNLEMEKMPSELQRGLIIPDMTLENIDVLFFENKFFSNNINNIKRMRASDDLVNLLEDGRIRQNTASIRKDKKIMEALLKVFQNKICDIEDNSEIKRINLIKNLVQADQQDLISERELKRCEILRKPLTAIIDPEGLRKGEKIEMRELLSILFDKRQFQNRKALCQSCIEKLEEEEALSIEAPKRRDTYKALIDLLQSKQIVVDHINKVIEHKAHAFVKEAAKDIAKLMHVERVAIQEGLMSALQCQGVELVAGQAYFIKIEKFCKIIRTVSLLSAEDLGEASSSKVPRERMHFSLWAHQEDGSTRRPGLRKILDAQAVFSS